MTRGVGSVGAAALWERFSGAVEGFVRARVSDPAAAEDVVQDIYVKLHERALTVRNEDRVTGWVFAVARNAVIDHYRARSRQEQPVARPEVFTAAPSPEESLTAPERTWDDLAECLPALLATLPGDQREAIELVELGGLTRAEAAAQVGISESGMKSRVQRARRNMARKLHDWCDLALDTHGLPIGCEPRAVPPNGR